MTYTPSTWTDEILAGDPRYDIKEDGGGAFKADMQIDLATAVSVAGTPVNAARMNNIEGGISDLDDLLTSIRAAATELTISAGAVTVTQSNHKLQPESGTADDLETISGTVDGQSGILYASDFGTDTITIKHNVGNILCVGGADIELSNGAVLWYSNGTKVFMVGGGGSSGGSSIWKAVPGSPTRVSNTQCDLTGDYSALLRANMYLKWTESGTERHAITYQDTTYGAGTSHVFFLGDVMTSIDAGSLMYCSTQGQPATARFVVAGTIGATGVDVANMWTGEGGLYYILYARVSVHTAGATGDLVLDINDGGTTEFTAKPTLGSGAYSVNQAANTGAYITTTQLTLDVDTIPTTPPVDLYVTVYLLPRFLLGL